VVRYTVRPDGTLDEGSARVIMHMADFASNHNGGQLQFGPDGLLYASTGAGEKGVGRILRFDPRDPKPEVYVTGLRNPWRFSFHQGALLIGDVGDHTWEEVDVVPKGAAAGTDFGWPAFEGPGGGARPLRLRRPLHWQAVERALHRHDAHRRPAAEAHRALPDLVRSRRPRPRLRRQLQRPGVPVVSSGTSQIAPSGGSVISAENAWLCHGIGSASMPP
jgi:hypothetical protein